MVVGVFRTKWTRRRPGLTTSMRRHRSGVVGDAGGGELCRRGQKLRKERMKIESDFVEEIVVLVLEIVGGNWHYRLKLTLRAGRLCAGRGRGEHVGQPC